MERLILIKNHLASNPNIPTQIIPKTKLIIEIYDENIGVISLNSAKDLNSLSIQMRNEIISALKLLDNDKKIKIIILQSKVDKIFCAGADIKEFPGITYESQLKDDVFTEFCLTFDKCKKPIIAAINGGAFGGGLEIALMCDIIICSDDAKLALPELKLGLIPGFGGTQRIYKVLGKYLAMKMILSSEPITGTMAKNYGLAVAIYNKEDLNLEALKLARKIAEKSVHVLLIAKDTLKRADELSLEHGLQYERRLFNSMFTLKATKEGVNAFLEKRPPNFKDL